MNSAIFFDRFPCCEATSTKMALYTSEQIESSHVRLVLGMRQYFSVKFFEGRDLIFLMNYTFASTGPKQSLFKFRSIDNCHFIVKTSE